MHCVIISLVYVVYLENHDPFVQEPNDFEGDFMVFSYELEIRKVLKFMET